MVGKFFSLLKRAGYILLYSCIVTGLIFGFFYSGLYHSLVTIYGSIQLGSHQEVEIGWDHAIPGQLLTSPFGVEDEITALITDTRYELLMWQYSITKKETIQLFKNIALRGGTVQIILENSMFGGNNKAWREFLNAIRPASIEVKSDEHLGTVYQHSKTILTDTHVIISTANLGFQGFWNNREYRFVTDYPRIVENLRELFYKDRKGKKITPDEIDQAVLFCPINCRAMLNALIESATSSILIQAQYLEDPKMINDLLQKQEEGVTVQIVAGKFQNESLLDGFEQRKIMDGPYLHAKNILIDRNRLLIGSMNISTNAIENNREISIVTTDPQSVARFSQQFYYDRAALPE